MKFTTPFFLFLFFGIGLSVLGQNKVAQFLKPADSLHIQKRNGVIISEAILSAGVLVGLNQLWYADYPKADFHFIQTILFGMLTMFGQIDSPL